MIDTLLVSVIIVYYEEDFVMSSSIVSNSSSNDTFDTGSTNNESSREFKVHKNGIPSKNGSYSPNWVFLLPKQEARKLLSSSLDEVILDSLHVEWNPEGNTKSVIGRNT